MKTLIIFVAMMLSISTTASFAHNGNGEKKKTSGGISNSRQHHTVIAGYPMKHNAAKMHKGETAPSGSKSAIKGTFRHRTPGSKTSAYKGVKKHRVIVGGSAKNTVRCTAQR